jgi:hypothetical protein
MKEIILTLFVSFEGERLPPHMTATKYFFEQLLETQASIASGDVVPSVPSTEGGPTVSSVVPTKVWQLPEEKQKVLNAKERAQMISGAFDRIVAAASKVSVFRIL